MFPVRALAIVAMLFAAQQPVFRSGVELVTIDVTVMDKRGEPLEGLGAAAAGELPTSGLSLWQTATQPIVRPSPGV